MNIVIGIAAYDGKACAETAEALQREQIMLATKGHRMHVAYSLGCSLVTHARNDLVGTFLSTGGDVLVFVDADVAWAPGSILALVEAGEDVVGGAYPHKKLEETYSVGWLTDTAQVDERGLVEVRTLPGGFLAVRRAVFERIAELEPERCYLWGETPLYCYFENPYVYVDPDDRTKGGSMVGEDAWFCLSWRKAGGKVFLMPDLTLTHIGGMSSFTGNVAEWLAEGNGPTADHLKSLSAA